MILGRIVVPGSVEARVLDSVPRVVEEAGLGMCCACVCWYLLFVYFFDCAKFSTFSVMSCYDIAISRTTCNVIVYFP